MLAEKLKEAAKAARASRHTLVLLINGDGVKVWAPRYGRLDREYLVTWEVLEDAIGNPLLDAIAQVEEALV